MYKKRIFFTRIFTVMCCLMIATSVCNAQQITSKQPSNGDGSKSNPYQISNANELYWFMEYVNSATDENKNNYANAILTKDITVNEGVLAKVKDKEVNDLREWFPIGYNIYDEVAESEEYVYYFGTFDGKGFTISGLYFNNPNQSYVGLFGQNSGTIQNVGVVDSYFYGENYVGGVCGANNVTITNCYNTGSVSGVYYLGGVCGYNEGEYATITNCYNTGSVSGNENAGGVCGSNYSTITNCYNTGSVSGKEVIGGVCGNNYNNATITNCYNTGSVSGGDKSKYVGGVCGYNYKSTISNCYYNNENYTGDAIGHGSGDATGKTLRQFYSGEVAYLLSQGCTIGEKTYSGDIWGQDLSDKNKTTYPELGGPKVNYNEVDNTYDNNTDEPTFDKQSNTYYIANGDQLRWFSNEVNNNRNNTANAILLNDIIVNIYVLTDAKGISNVGEDGSYIGETCEFYIWSPIGTEGYSYMGTFEGNNHTISGLFLDEPDESRRNYVGLFGQNTGTIKNVGIVDSYLKGIDYVGGVCGKNGRDDDFDEYKESGTIINCYNTGSVLGNDNVGGVCGYNYVGSIENCYNTGSVSGGDQSEYVGGVCGSNYSTITNCYNTGSVSGGDESQYVGGVCGYNYSTITNCYNTGSVFGSEDIGGVCGDNDYATITNCYNTGSVSGKNNIDGISGEKDYASITNCYNNSDFYNEGTLTTFDFCNGKLFEGFSSDVWSAGSIVNNDGELTFVFPHFKDGYKYTIPGRFVANTKSGDYYADETFTKESLDLSISYSDITLNEITDENLEFTDVDLSKSQTISGKYYGVDFSFGIKIIGYTYKAPEFTWSADLTSAEVLFVCNEKESKNEILPCEVSIDTTRATCTVDGTIEYVASVTFNGGTYTDTVNVALPANGHAYGEPTFAWTSYMSAKATFVCDKKDGTKVVDGEITSDTVAVATTEAEGKVVHKATFTFNGKTYTDSVSEVLPRIGLVYGEPKFAWTGYTSVKATFVSTDGSDTKVVDGAIASDTVAVATTEAEGKVVHKATFTFNGKTYTDSVSEVLPKVVLIVYGEPTFAWTGYTSAKATFVSTDSTDTKVVDGAITSDTVAVATAEAEGKVVYTATFTFNGKTYTDSVSEVLPRVGLVYGEPTFEWTGYTSAKATFVSTDGSDTKVVEGEITSDTVAVATVEAEGKVVYTASFAFNGKTYTDSVSEVLPRVGLVYGEPTFAWTGYTSAKATFVSTDGSDTKVVDGAITSDTVAVATAEAEGKVVYTATFTFNGKTFTDSVSEVLPKLNIDGIDTYISDIKVWGSNGVVCVENAEGQIQVFDINGRMIKVELAVGSFTQISLNQSGIYIVKVGDKSYRVAL